MAGAAEDVSPPVSIANPFWVKLALASGAAVLFFLPGIAVFLFSDWLKAKRQFLRFPALAMTAFFTAWWMTGVTFSQPKKVSGRSN